MLTFCQKVSFHVLVSAAICRFQSERAFRLWASPAAVCVITHHPSGRRPVEVV